MRPSTVMGRALRRASAWRRRSRDERCRASGRGAWRANVVGSTQWLLWAMGVSPSGVTSTRPGIHSMLTPAPCLSMIW